jgi:phosphatidylinositol 3-kinase
MFKSALAPILATFDTVDGTPYKVIFKSGDDLRQDQLIIQLINLMDSLLKKVNLDLKLTPYRVLATSPLDGFVEFVPRSHTLTAILEKYDKDIGKFLSAHNNRPSDLANALDTFVKSCAGYCVITYILGIGDRHLENVLLTTSGHLFHIDFGWCFGRDPKPFPPPMKFSKEMVEAMGGADSIHYRDFRKAAVLAFNILRKHSHLILNLLNLMRDAHIPDLSVNQDLERVLLKVQDKFRLDLTEDQAELYILSLIDDSVSALFPLVIDKIHKWAMYWK